MILTVIIEPVPRVNPQQRMQLEKIGRDFTRVILHFGFMESPNVPKTLAIARKRGLSFDIMSTLVLPVTAVDQTGRSLGHAALAGQAVHLPRQNGDDASSYFQLPTDRVVEIGTQFTV